MPFDLSKRAWHPSPLPSHIVVVSTTDAEGTECRRHLECTYDVVQTFGRDVFLVGRDAVAADRDCVAGPFADQYANLNPIVFLEDGTYALLAAARRVDGD